MICQCLCSKAADTRWNIIMLKISLTITSTDVGFYTWSPAGSLCASFSQVFVESVGVQSHSSDAAGEMTDKITSQCLCVNMLTFPDSETNSFNGFLKLYSDMRFVTFNSTTGTLELLSAQEKHFYHSWGHCLCPLSLWEDIKKMLEVL